ncbi:MAG: hypothetical protein NUW08_01880 [Candidatus Uhrbacteria bacterium]|nr:hypothetical protein [Candidatus Uhrbacteria bacterium]
MAQVSSAARPLPEEHPSALEKAERKPTPERAERPVEKALEGGSPEKIVSIFQGRATEEKQAMERLGLVEPEEAEAVPEEATRVAKVTEQTCQKIDQVASSTLMEVQALLGTLPVPTVETVMVAPTVAVGDVAPKAEVAPVEKSEEELEADEQRAVAAEVIKENYEALSGFAKEHDLSLNEQAFQIAEQDLLRLTKPERMYAQVLMGKHAAGRGSLLHAEKLIEAYELPEGDPKRTELMEEAQKLANDALVKEKGAQAMQQNYMNLPEIMALAGVGGDETGGGYGGANFEAQSSPFGEKPPTGGSRGGGMYDVGGAPGSGLTKIEAYKASSAEVKKRKPNFIERFFNKNWKDMSFGGGGDGGSRE